MNAPRAELPGSLKVATVWLLLALALFLGVRAWQSQREGARFAVDGGVVELQRSSDGHYHWPGTFGGKSIDWLVDTGASRSAVPLALVREVGLPTAGSVRSSTAGGTVVGTIAQADVVLHGGVRADRLPVVVLPGLAAPLLGMDVLGRLRWQQADGVLRIDLRGAQ